MLRAVMPDMMAILTGLMEAVQHALQSALSYARPCAKVAYCTDKHWQEIVLLSVLDLFRIGIGPSSSHTVGPMRIAKHFITALNQSPARDSAKHLRIILRGSLAYTGIGHATPHAIQLGLLAYSPETIDSVKAHKDVEDLQKHKRLRLDSHHSIIFDPQTDIILDYDQPADLHPNEVACIAYDPDHKACFETVYYSTGGGFIATAEHLQRPVKHDLVKGGANAPYPFGSCAELLEHCQSTGKSISDIVLANELGQRGLADIDASLMRIYTVMMACVDRGLKCKGSLPGNLKVERRAADLWETLEKTGPVHNSPEQIFDYLNIFAMAVNEENAAGGQVVTAPTNGAAGIIPAVLRYYCPPDEMRPEQVQTFLLTAGGIGLLYKQRASISGAEMGCQGEVGVACSMAAAGLAAIWGCSPQRISQAAEIAMEHNLGLTCDPVAGLVQIPCIERNAIGAVKAVNAARMAFNAHASPKVTLDQVIETMRQTGLDMSTKYKETSQGGLAVNVVEC